MKTLILISVLFSIEAFAGWAQKAKSHLPPKVQALELGKSDREAARKALGKPDLVRGDKEYWIIDGFKYALELTYKNNKLSSLHYNFSRNGFPVETLKGDFDPKLLKASPTAPHTSLMYEDKEGKIEVEMATGKVESLRFQ